MADPTRLRIDLAYDGAPFAGFARQRDRVTVQGTLEAACAQVLGIEPVSVGAGRTDRGVHALAQVVHLDVDLDVVRDPQLLADLADLRVRLDRLVGEAITIWAVRSVGPGFHARFAATGRGYRYRLADTATMDPLERHHRWQVGEALAVGAMRAAARHLVGEHDFASFCRRDGDRTLVRRLDEVAVSRPRAGRVDVRLAGRSFCHQQVRSIVGCLVEVGRGRRQPDWVAALLAARDRSVAGPVAPPHGLVLERVTYGRRWPAAPPPEART